MLKVCILASGSSGNCTYIASEETAILVDAGLSYKETARRLESLGADISDIGAVCITHEHDDHTACLGILRRRLKVNMYANTGTIEALQQAGKLQDLPWNVFTTGTQFEIGDMKIQPFSVPHDSYDPVGFIVSSNDSRAGIVTDMGTATGLIRERLRDCRTVIIEANHDEQLLRDAARPWSLKQRIASRQGHLSNKQAGQLLIDIMGPELKVVFLAHLSSECNRPELVVKMARKVLDDGGHGDVEVKLTYQDRVSDLVVV